MTIRSSGPLRIVTLDDHAILLRGINDVLRDEAAFELVGSYTSSLQLLKGLQDMPVDVAIIDYSLAPDDMDGLNLLKTLQTRYPDLVVLVISALYNSATVALALRCGARGFIGKNFPPEELVNAIHIAGSGKIYIEPDMALQLAQLQDSTAFFEHRESHYRDAVKKAVTLSVLSPKEQEVIRCFLAGMTVSDIAEKFSRSIKTISGQKQTALRKLGLKADHELFLIRDSLK